MQKILLANWKMYYGPVEAGGWMRTFRRERLPKDLEIGIAVPHVSLAAAKASLGRASVPFLGAQDAFWMSEGSFTGEISPEMLKEFEVRFCLVGHSERRIHLGETDAMVSHKAAALQKAGIRPVVCVGENAAERKKGETRKIVRAQVLAAFRHGLKAEGSALPMFAYEPLWSIYPGKPCSPEDVKAVHQHIRETIEKEMGKAAAAIPLLYGGSVDVRNVADYLSTTHIDGALVGHASLDPRGFGLLCRAALPL